MPRPPAPVPPFPTPVVSHVDHLVYASPELARGVAEVEALLGVRAAPGGQHPGRGTRNALLSLGPRSYLEIIAPDPEQPRPSTPRWFGIDRLGESRLIAWAAHATDLEGLRSAARAQGVALGAVASGGRALPDGTRLSWTFTDPDTLVADAVVPFFIDWGGSPHPARTAPHGATLMDLRAEHPDHGRVRHALDALGVALSVADGPRPSLIAVIQSPRGIVELR